MNKLLCAVVAIATALLPPMPGVADTARSGYQFAVVSPASPSRLHMIWTPFTDYLSRHLDAEVELVFPKGIDAVEELIDAGNADFVYLNSYLYYRLNQKGKLDALAQMVNLEGEITSRGSFIVRANSGIESVDELRGRSLTVISPLGAGAYLAPRAYLKSREIDIDADLELTFSGDLKKSVYAVLLGDADAATMCGVNYKILEHKLDLRELIIIDSTDAFPETVIAARSGIDDTLAERVKGIIVDMVYTSRGRLALAPLGDIKIRSFVEYDPGIETITEQLLD